MDDKKSSKLKEILKEIKKSQKGTKLGVYKDVSGVSKETFNKEQSSNEGYQPTDKLDTSNPPIDKGKEDKE